MEFEPVIGLEVHVELNTASKIFCSCPTTFGSPPNSNVCPVCCGMPGVLPVLNGAAMEKAALAGLALEGTISSFTRFDRKQYFYPDLPKGYQISQLDHPVMRNGRIVLETETGPRTIRINRLHLEEDAGKLLHSETPGDDASRVDLNRAGVPLIEIVSEPDIGSAKEAVQYLVELRKIMKFSGVSDVNMEEGSLRCDANVSIRPKGEAKLGTRVEIKNMNSFRYIEKAINHEIKRQTRVIEEGGRIVQETRLYDSGADRTIAMRSKEEANDYRYFPEPDLVPYMFDAATVEKIRSSLPELPGSLRKKFAETYGLPAYDADLLSSERPVAVLFEETAKLTKNPKTVSNWIMTDVLKFLNDSGTPPEKLALTPLHLAELIASVEKGTLSGKMAKEVLAETLSTGKSPAEIVKEKGLVQESDSGKLETVADEVLAENADAVAKYKSGKTGVLGALVGAMMKKTAGRANPKLCNEILARKLS
jgi:aspartyl-tRNA(Asn)/glutamyl-tRNA(Gln) amidotransferase subunit B